MYGKTETQCKLDLAVSNSQDNKAYACSTYYTNSRSAIRNISADILFVYTFSFFFCFPLALSLAGYVIENSSHHRT